MSRSPGDALLLFVARVHGMLCREQGQTLSEYALLISLVAVGTTVIGLIAFRTQLSAGFDQMSNCLTGGC